MSFLNRVAQSLRALLAVSAVAVAMAATDGLRAEEIVQRPDLDAVFRNAGVAGTFVLFDVAADRLIVVNGERASRRDIPASTFKIANSLIVLETGVVSDEYEIVPYGGKPQPIKAWEKDMGLREAIAVSNVPIYQALARQVGLKSYTAWLGRLGYGNGQVGENVETFWLRGPLRISAVEQVKFLARLARKQLPMSTRAQDIVRDILLLFKTEGGPAIFAKTGWSVSSTPQIGWWVGWVEKEDRVYPFALNIDIQGKSDLPKRTTLGLELLSRLELR